MNKEIQDFARTYLKENLLLCTSQNIVLFKQMYSPADFDRNINDIIDAMSAEKLDWAMEQVRRTIEEAAANQKKEA